MGKVVGSNLPSPPEEHKLKDDYVMDVQVSYFDFIFNNMLFKNYSTRLKTYKTTFFFFFFDIATGLKTICLLEVMLLKQTRFNNKRDISSKVRMPLLISYLLF